MSDLYLDAYSGLSGDMLLGALLDLGAPLEEITDVLARLSLKGWRIEAEDGVRQGIRGTRACVNVETGEQPHRSLSDVRAVLLEGDLPYGVASDALAVFELLARAEAKVHGTSVEEVRFHEVGAVDAILDVVGVCLGLRLLGVERVYCSPLPLGTGFVRSEHGVLPVPAPAVVELLSGCGAPVLPGRGEGEMVTPTGAALVAHFADFSAPAGMHVVRVGYGFGAREMPWPNAMRALLVTRERSLGQDTVILVECNLDDMAGEQVPEVVVRLLEAGALDAWTEAITMKKGRPALRLGALAPKGGEREVAAAMLRETTTLGVRYSEWSRFKAEREVRTLSTPYGEARVKLKLLDGEVVAAAPEYEDCARIAREHGIALGEVYDLVRRSAEQLRKGASR